MNYLKSALAMLAFLALGVGTGLMVRVVVGANVGEGRDVQWFDSQLAGASATSLPAALDAPGCDGCDAAIAWLDGAARPAADASDEARRIAHNLDGQSVPLLRVANDQITYIDLASLEAPRRATALR